MPLVVSPAVISKDSPDLAGLLKKGFCVKEPPNFRRTRSLVINVDKTGRVVAQSSEEKNFQRHSASVYSDEGLTKTLKRPKSCSENASGKTKVISATDATEQSKTCAAKSFRTATFSVSRNSKLAPGIQVTKVSPLKEDTVSGNESPKNPVANTSKPIAIPPRNSTYIKDTSHIISTKQSEGTYCPSESAGSMFSQEALPKADYARDCSKSVNRVSPTFKDNNLNKKGATISNSSLYDTKYLDGKKISARGLIVY